MAKYINADEIPYATEKRITYKVLIDEMPFIEIVRCKECRYFQKLNCAMYDLDLSEQATENDFCSRGKKRDETWDETSLYG